MLNSLNTMRAAVTLTAVSFPFAAIGLDSTTTTEASLPMPQYEVRITNITRGQIFSPPVVATHGSDATPIYTLGSAASSELAGLAEDALNQPLIDLLNQSPGYGDVQVAMGQAGPIMPGETATVVVNAQNSRSMVSLVGMLVVTNDAFVGLNGFRLPTKGEVSVLAHAYDAGSEANTEDCAHIPGPPCGNAMVRVTTGAEGYVHAHAGIHGIGTLRPEAYDWRGPVAQITVRRL